MKTLYLVRHAKSSWRDVSLEDFDRPLSGRGKRDAPRIGAYLREHGHKPQRIVSSPAKRARGTAKRIALAMNLPRDQILLHPDLYAFDEGAGVLAVLSALEDSLDRVMAIGHNPCFTALVNRLTALGLDNLPTCGVVGVALEADTWRALGQAPARTVLQVFPRELVEPDSDESSAE